MPVLSRFTPGNDAIPDAAVTAPPPTSVEPPAFVPIASVTCVVLSVSTVLPNESRIVTVTGCDWSAAIVAGGVWNASAAAGPAVTVTGMFTGGIANASDCACTVNAPATVPAV